MRTILRKEIKRERCNAAALGAFNASVSDYENVSYTNNKKENLELSKKFIEENGFDVIVESWKGNQVAVYNNTTGVIHLNSRSVFWKDPNKLSEYNFKIGHLASSKGIGVLHHEIAHGKFKAPDNFWNNQQREIIRKQVSRYAATNPKEFVSEVYSGIKTGRKYGKEIMQMFNSYAIKNQEKIKKNIIPEHLKRFL